MGATPHMRGQRRERYSRNSSNHGMRLNQLLLDISLGLVIRTMYIIKLCNIVIALQITFFLLSLYLFSLLLSFLLVFSNKNPFNHKTTVTLPQWILYICNLLSSLPTCNFTRAPPPSKSLVSFSTTSS